MGCHSLLQGIFLTQGLNPGLSHCRHMLYCLRCISKMKVKSLSRVRLCNPMDCSLPGSSVRGIFQARVLEWVAISFSRGSSQPRESNLGLPHCRKMLYHLSHQGSHLLHLNNRQNKNENPIISRQDYHLTHP